LVKPPLPAENIISFYVALLRQRSNTRTAIEEKALARELDLPGSGCSSAFTPYLSAGFGIGSARLDGRYARA
jgi:hypothetical protein